MRKKAMEVFGSNFDEIIIGGAPFNAEVERFLKQIGFPYTIAYGMTEWRSYHLFQPLGNLETGLLRKSHHPHGSKDRLSRPSERGRRNNL